jgi:hypothetical protein
MNAEQDIEVDFLVYSNKMERLLSFIPSHPVSVLS